MSLMTARPQSLRAQSGVSLIFALLALVAMTVGAVALIRSVDTGILALGNLSFKQGALSAGARATDQAVTFLEANILGPAIEADIADKGYYATSMDTLDPTARSASAGLVLALVDWDANGCKVNGVNVGPSACLRASDEIDVGGDKARYIITRLCQIPGRFDAAGQNCASPRVIGFADANDKGLVRPGGRLGEPTYNPYFRIITRTAGPKGTVSYTETLVHF